MLDNYKSIPFLVGISILLITPVSIGAFVYSSFRADNAKQSTESESTADSNFAGSTAKSTTRTAPPPTFESSGGDINDDSTTGISIGKYSTPPTTIRSSEITPSTSQQSIGQDWESSINRNRAIQRTMNSSADRSIPDYSQPAASNNYQERDNSLIEPLEDNSQLETPQSSLEPVSPSTELLSPSQPLTNIK